MPDKKPVSDLQQQVAQLQTLSNFQTEIIDALPGNLLVIDTNFNILKHNRAVTEISTEKNLVGMNTLESVEFYQSKELHIALTEFIKQNDKQTENIVLPHPLQGGNIVHHLSKMNDVAGLEAIILYSIAMQDNNSGQVNDFIQEKFTSLGAFAGKIAHDINNPLSVVLTRIDFLQSMDLENAIEEGDVEIVEEIGIIQRQAQRIYDILDKIGALQMHAKEVPAECDITEIVTRAVTIAEFQRPHKTVHAEKELAENLPKMVCNEIKLERAINEMMKNAFEAAGENGDVKISLSFDEPNYRISISNSGNAIPEEDQSRVFDPFFSTKQGIKGAGLGLTIAYSAALAHNGRIEINSSKDVGTTMTMVLVNIDN